MARTRTLRAPASRAAWKMSRRGSDAAGGVVARGKSQPFDHGGRVGGRVQALYQVHRVVDQSAGQVPGRVALEGAAWRVGGLLGDPGEVQRVAVDHVVVPAALDQDGVAVGGLIQFGGGGQAALGEVELLPVDGGADPFPVRGDGGALADQVEELWQAPGPVHRDVSGAEAGEDEVSVGVVERREHGGVRRVHDVRVRADQRVEPVRVGREG
jgi:hypothetical protein